MPPAPAPRALILAAGRGERMRPLTDERPKPLLPVHGRPLIEWHLQALAAAGVHEVVINVAWLGQQLVDAIGDGPAFGLRIHWSREDLDPGHALETAGGIAKALPHLADHPDDLFWVVSGDIFAPGFRFDPGQVRRLAEHHPERDAHLWLVPNPPYHPGGDFGLDPSGRCTAGVDAPAAPTWTYANLALMRARLVNGIAPGERAALGPLLFDAARRGSLGGELWAGEWHNVGTPDQWAALQTPPGTGR
jgi:N-acetyl-alpha-D-muramate 1-phosphate uridylyltransferase